MWKENRPKLELEDSLLERFLIYMTSGIYIVWVIFLVVNWPSIPAEVPAHFGIEGEITRWGSKWEMLILPVISGVLGFVLIWLRKHPEWYNMPVRITEQNAEFYYRLTRHLLMIISFVMVAGFAWLSYDIIQIAKGHSPFLEGWFMPTFLISMFAPIVYFLYKTVRYQTSSKK